jgi:hypothetical protein
MKTFLIDEDEHQKHKISEGRERKVLMTAQAKHRILITGDSHVRNYAE